MRISQMIRNYSYTVPLLYFMAIWLFPAEMGKAQRKQYQL